MCPELGWRRVGIHGAAMAIAVAGHLAIAVWLLAPPAPRSDAHRHVPMRTLPPPGVLRVSLLMSSSSMPSAAAHALVVPAIHSPRHKPTRRTVQPARSATAPLLRVTPWPAPASTAPLPAFVEGGRFAARLRHAPTRSAPPRLPGGHQYTAKPLTFMSIEQRSMAGRVHKVAGFVFGWFDPACKNAQYELAKSRAQQIADGYTREDLERLVHEHCH